MTKLTLCVNCTYHKGSGEWYDHFCKHPEVRFIPDIDPVTGEKGYAKTNDLGRGSLTDTPYPYCRDINQGQCPYFKESINIIPWKAW